MAAQAGEKARNLYANEAAIRHLTAALELMEGLPADEPHLRQRWEVVSHLTKAYSDCRAFERAQEVLQDYLVQLQDLCGDLARAVVKDEAELSGREEQQTMYNLTQAHDALLAAQKRVEGGFRGDED